MSYPTEQQRLRLKLRKLEERQRYAIAKLAKTDLKDSLQEQKKLEKLEREMAKRGEVALKRAEKLQKDEAKKQLAAERRTLQREMMANKQKRVELNRSKLEHEELTLREEQRLMEERDQAELFEAEAKMWQSVLEADIPVVTMEDVPRKTHMQSII